MELILWVAIALVVLFVGVVATLIVWWVIEIVKLLRAGNRLERASRSSSDEDPGPTVV